ncbi:MAG: type II toxin-antitoxin system Phd/YefM family antitoxin [Mycobacterium sp.]
MATPIGLGQLRSDACNYFERVAAGETIEVIRRGRLVARIVSAAHDSGEIWIGAPPGRVGGSRVGLDELRTRAGRCFDRVAGGETIEVVRRGMLVARIVSTAG